MLAERIVERVAARLTRALAPPRTALLPFIVDGHDAGYLAPDRAQRLARMVDVFTIDAGALRFVDALASFAARTRAIGSVTRVLEAEGALSRWRDERYRVSLSLASPPFFEIERAATRYFGIATHAAHVNATALRGDELRMWIARRSATKPLDPGLLDNLVGGGVAAGMSIEDTVVKESREEAGIPPEIASRARRRGTVKLFREQFDGIQRETLHVFDLELPGDFVPRNEDGEVADYRLATIDDVATWIGDAEGANVVTDDASLVIVDWMLRHGRVQQSSPWFAVLESLRG